MNIDSLFSLPARSNSAVASEIRAALNDLRRRPLTFAAGCGCAVSFSAISTREFEELLVFHVTERWRAIGPDGEGALPPVPDPSQINGLDALLDWVLALESAGKPAECRALLEEIRRSIASFVRQCSNHRMKAENV
jgi:hypothetical protein